MPMTVTEFDTGKQATFRLAIGAAAGVSMADVTIVKVESISSARQRGGMVTTRRRLLAAGIRIDMSVKAANKNAADALGAKLTITVINAKLQQAGMPAAAILEAPKTASTSGDTAAASGEGNSNIVIKSSASDRAAGSGICMLPSIIAATASLVFLLAA